MSDLKMKTVTVYEVDAYDFEQFVNDQGCMRFSFQADQECADDTDHKFTVDGELHELDQSDVEAVLDGGYDSFMAGHLLNHFANVGLIPKGDYLIRVY